MSPFADADNQVKAVAEMDTSIAKDPETHPSAPKAPETDSSAPKDAETEDPSSATGPENSISDKTEKLISDNKGKSISDETEKSISDRTDDFANNVDMSSELLATNADKDLLMSSDDDDDDVMAAMQITHSHSDEETSLDVMDKDTLANNNNDGGATRLDVPSTYSSTSTYNAELERILNGEDSDDDSMDYIPFKQVRVI